MILQPMLKRAPIAASMLSALAVTAPAAAASVLPLNATDVSRATPRRAGTSHFYT